MTAFAIDIEKLRVMLRYDTSTGQLIWLVHSGRPYPKGKRCSPHKAPNGYLAIHILGRKVHVHRVIWALHYGQWPEGEIDHIDGNRANNTLENLRDVSRTLNKRNCRLNANNTSGHPGIIYRASNNKWIARIGDGVRSTRYLGIYDSKQEAIAARKAAEARLGYHANHGRSPIGAAA